MSRASCWFAFAALALVVLGLCLPRFGSLPSPVISLMGTGYGIPNSLLCHAAAACFCAFSFLYGIYFLPWSERAQMWHFGLSISIVCAFAVSMLMAKRTLGHGGSSTGELVSMVVYVLSPWVFVLLQGGFLADALRRVAQGPVAFGRMH